MKKTVLTAEMTLDGAMVRITYDRSKVANTQRAATIAAVKTNNEVVMRRTLLEVLEGAIIHWETDNGPGWVQGTPEQLHQTPSMVLAAMLKHIIHHAQVKRAPTA